MKRICSCGNSSWRWGTDSSGKPMMFCVKCDQPTGTDLFSAEEVAMKFGVARSTIIKMVLTQKIESTSIEKQYRFSPSQIQEYLDRRTIKRER